MDKDTNNFDTYPNGQTDSEPRLPISIPKGASLQNPPTKPVARKADPAPKYDGQGLLLVRTANKCIEEAKTRPIPKRLFGDFWFEGELCILFADTNLGKSILAVQVGDSISQGQSIKGLPMEAQAQTVLYMDFELGDKQFEVRYSSDFQNHYRFSERFFRTEIDPDTELPNCYLNDFEGFLNYSIEKAIKETGATVLIVDNLTYLKNETEKAKDALPLMKHLKALKSKYGLSILALAHTPKRDLSKPITRNDLQGSKMLINFCDSSFSIGESFKDKSLRYLKQIKARNTEINYDSENVVVFEVSKPYNFLQFDFLNFETEREHLRAQSETESADWEKQVKDEMARQPDATAYAIAKALCGPDDSRLPSLKVKVYRTIKRLKKEAN